MLPDVGIEPEVNRFFKQKVSISGYRSEISQFAEGHPKNGKVSSSFPDWITFSHVSLYNSTFSPRLF